MLYIADVKCHLDDRISVILQKCTIYDILLGIFGVLGEKELCSDLLQVNNFHMLSTELSPFFNPGTN